MEQGYIHVYTGNGKGKTTAAFGLAVRAACSGETVFIGQFMKGTSYSESTLPTWMDGITIEQFCMDSFSGADLRSDAVAEGTLALERCATLLREGLYDVVVFDEVFIALYFKLFTAQRLIEVLDGRHPKVEVILTGRYAPQEIIDHADLVTEMKEIRHYYDKGVLSRKGIDC